METTATTPTQGAAISTRRASTGGSNIDAMLFSDHSAGVKHDDGYGIDKDDDQRLLKRREPYCATVRQSGLIGYYAREDL